MADEAEKARRRWFPSAPDRCVLGLLALEGFLLLSAWFRWFPFNQHKGWSVLICLATVGAAFVLMFLWFVLALVFRWRFQYGILSLFVLVVAVALPFAWLETEMNAARKQREAVEGIEKVVGMVSYDYEYDPSGQMIPGATTPMRPWLRKLLGDDLFVYVTGVDFAMSEIGDAGLEQLTGLTQLQVLDIEGTKVGDAGLERLTGLTSLQRLDLACTNVGDAGLRHLKGLIRLQRLRLDGTKVTDAGLEHLKGLSRLQELHLEGTKVTDAGVKKLQQALPNCVIRH